MPETEPLFYNAHHSPIGAFSSFTLGYAGPRGGLGLELGSPANESVWIGVEDIDSSTVRLLPFCDAGSADDERRRYEVGSEPLARPEASIRLQQFDRSEIKRDFGVAHDTWTAGDLTFTIISPVRPIPDPATADEGLLREVLAPAVLVELTVDNRRGSGPRRALFGYGGSDRSAAMRTLVDEKRGLQLIGQGTTTAIASADPACIACQGFTLDLLLGALPANRRFGLGGATAFVMDVPAGEQKTYRFAVCFFRSGRATAGLPTSYYYTQLFDDIESVACYALAHFDLLKTSAAEADAWLAGARLSADQRFMLAHAIRSYYGSTQLLERDGAPLWVVNEGEYRMMNTFDLTVDQLFYELRMSPWTVPNVLDQYVSRYSYRDEARFPGDPALHPGGLSFTHDMGVANVFSPSGRSSYELAGISVCFSHMTHEQLVNWVLCTGVYVHQASGWTWLEQNAAVVRDCFASMVARDHPDPNLRNGVMSLDSSRVDGGGEITTYDSLDASLGQARANLYLAGKTWAAYIVLEKLLAKLGSPDLAAAARDQAGRCARTITASAGDGGLLPAVLAETLPNGTSTPPVESRIIPAIEGLVFPLLAGCPEALEPAGPYGDYIAALRRHLEAVLKPGTCLFGDGGWKLSSTSDNSWLSKIYLCQFIAREILCMDGPRVTADPDKAHVDWLLHPEQCYWAWSDQIVAGVAGGSKYYPRGVTAILWLEESPETDGALGNRLLPG